MGHRLILQRSLAADPAARYAEIHEMRKAVDALLFSGDFTPSSVERDSCESPAI